MTGEYVLNELYNYFKGKLIKKINLSKKISTEEKSKIKNWIEKLSKKELLEIMNYDEIQLLSKIRG